MISNNIILLLILRRKTLKYYSQFGYTCIKKIIESQPPINGISNGYQLSLFIIHKSCKKKFIILNSHNKQQVVSLMCCNFSSWIYFDI